MGFSLPPHQEMFFSQNHVFFGPQNWPKMVPGPKCRPGGPKIWPGGPSQNLRGGFSVATPSFLGANPSFSKANLIFSKANPSFSDANPSFFEAKPRLLKPKPSLGVLPGASPLLDPIFRENVPKTLIFTRFGSRRGTRKRIQRIHRIQRIQWKGSTAGSSHPRLLAPEARMTVVKQTPSNYV